MEAVVKELGKNVSY